MDTLGTSVLSIIWRLSLFRRFQHAYSCWQGARSLSIVGRVVRSSECPLLEVPLYYSDCFIHLQLRFTVFIISTVAAAPSSDWCCGQVCRVLWSGSGPVVHCRQSNHLQHVSRVWSHCGLLPSGQRQHQVPQTNRYSVHVCT